jgi:hypothetical protein
MLRTFSRASSATCPSCAEIAGLGHPPGEESGAGGDRGEIHLVVIWPAALSARASWAA